MFRRLSVLPLFFIILVVLFLSADIGLAYSAGPSSQIGSPTVPVSSYDRGLSSGYSQGSNYGRSPAATGYGTTSRGFRDLSPYRTGSNFRRPLGYSNFNSLRRRSLGYQRPYQSYNSLDRYEQYLLPSAVFNPADTGSTRTQDLSRPPLSRGMYDYRLPRLDEKQSGIEYRREKYRGIQSREINVFQGPLSTDSTERVRNLQRLSARRKMDNEELLHKNQVYLKQDKSFSQEATLDVNLSEKSLNDKVLKENIFFESLPIPESLQIEKPLSAEEFRQKYADMLAEKLKDELNDEVEKELEDLLKDKSDTNTIDKLKILKRGDAKTKPRYGKNGKNDKKDKDAESTDPPDPMAGVTPGNIDAKLKESREKVKKFKNFENQIKEQYLEYIKAADKYLAEGQYYNAMDSYQIAGAWKNNDPRAYAGKAFAHLAVAEYASSSTLLIRSLESSGDFAARETDVAALIGNKKLYDKRLGEVKSLYKAGKYYKTAFLLAYLYCQDGDLVKAKECIDTAAPKMNKTRAWKSLSKAIEKRIKSAGAQAPR